MVAKDYGVSGTTCLEPLCDKLRAFGWHVIECDGHSMKELTEAYANAASMVKKPSMVVANTIKGKGISFIEDKGEWHHGFFNANQCREALQELNDRLRELTDRRPQ